MIRTFVRCFFACALCVTLALGLSVTAQAQNQGTIDFLSVTTSSDYSDLGLDIGNAGFWFANFDAATANSGSAIDFNAANSLPSWATINPTPDTTFSSTASTKGGQGYSTLTLPDGTTGESGAVVDSNTISNSNNTIRQLILGPGSPGQFFLHIVTDNTNGTHDPAGRLRARGQHDFPNGNEIWSVNGPNAPGGLAGNMDGSPDVYTFHYRQFGDGSYIKLQLNDGGTSNPITGGASIAGIMFDLVPEPSSALLLMLGAVGCGCARLRRRG